MGKTLYPLLFSVISQPAPWAGHFLPDYLADVVPSLTAGIGTVWQVVDSPNLQSQVTNGVHAGKTLRELVADMPEQLVGRRHLAEDRFPVCARLLNVGMDQPCTVYPDPTRTTEFSADQTNATFWYCLDSQPGAQMVAGIAARVTGQQLLLQLNRPGLMRLLQGTPARPGDAYLIPPGMLHRIGAGSLVWELRERVNDGFQLTPPDMEQSKPTDQQDKVLRATQIEVRQNPRISRESSPMTHTRRIPLTPNCPYFNVDEIRLFDPISMRATGDSFHLLNVVHGEVVVEADDEQTVVKEGQVCCVPAAMGDYRIRTERESAELLRVTRHYVL